MEKTKFVECPVVERVPSMRHTRQGIHLDIATRFTGSRQSLVDGAIIYIRCRDTPIGTRNEPYHRHLRKQLLRTRLTKLHPTHIPARTLYKQTSNIAPVWRGLCNLRPRLRRHLQTSVSNHTIRVTKITWKLKEIVSIEIIFLRAKFCKVPVRKAWGKKKPLIQKTGGMPLSIQVCMNTILSWRSMTHDARGFKLGYALDAQLLGTLLSYREFDMFSNASDITTRPWIAFNRSLRLDLMIFSSRLYLVKT